MCIDTLPFVITEYHLLWLALQCCNLCILLPVISLTVVPFLLGSEFLNTATVDLEFVVAEAAFVLCCVLIVRDGRVEVENILIWRFQLTKQVGNVGIIDA